MLRYYVALPVINRGNSGLLGTPVHHSLKFDVQVRGRLPPFLPCYFHGTHFS